MPEQIPINYAQSLSNLMRELTQYDYDRRQREFFDITPRRTITPRSMSVHFYKMMFYNIIEDISKPNPYTIKVILKGTCGENNSNFISKKHEKAFKSFKELLPFGMKLICYDKYGNLVEGEDES